MLVIVLLLILAGLFFIHKNKILLSTPPLPKSSSDLIQEFSGSYYMGDGLGLNCYFELSPDETFTIHWATDTGAEADYQGSISVKNLRLVLEPSVKMETPAMCFHRTFIPVNWGERKYLLPDDNDELSEIINSFFCDRVKSGDEPRSDVYGLSYLRITDITIRAGGYPIRQDGQLQCP